MSKKSRLGDFLRINADAPAALGGPFKLHFAVNGGEDGVVAAQADVRAGLDAGAPLPDDDRSGASTLVTRSPPNFLTPSRLETLSLPLLVLPPAFLWAISYFLLFALVVRAPENTCARFCEYSRATKGDSTEP